MKKRGRARRAIAMLLTAVMCVTCMPAIAFADDETEEDEQIRQTLLESVDAEEYPQGMFDFLTPRMETSEDVDEAEFAIVRRGNTDEAASVVFKAIDMTAKYGEDYTIEVTGRIFDKTLPENPEAELLVYDAETAEDSSEIELMGESNEATENVEIDGDADDESIENNDEAVNNFEEDAEDIDGVEIESTEEDEEDEADIEEEEYVDDSADSSSTNKASSLQSARTVLTGAASDYTNWREADEETTAMLAEAYGEMYDELEGVEYTLEFEPGEYMKTLKFKTIDDKISEDEEQVLFVLSHPENGAISENPTGFMNIADNDEPEEITFGFSENYITVDEDGDIAELIIERKTGLYRYGTVVVSSAEYTAAEGEYYDGFATEIAFVPGQEYKKIEIPIKKHPYKEDVSFRVCIDGSSEKATVNIAHNRMIGEIEGNDAVSAGTAQLMSDDAELMAGNNPAIWCRKETITPSVVSNNGSYKTHDGDSNYWAIPIGSYGQDSSIKLSIDLSMVGKIKVTSQEYYEGTWYDDTWSFLWFSGGSSGYYHDMWNYIKIGNDKKVEHYHKYNTSDTISLLDDNDRKAGSITYGTRVSGNCHDAMGLFQKSIEVYYLPIEVQIGTYDDDAMIQKKIYTSATSTKNDGSSFHAGKLKFAGESASTTSKFFYNNDIVRFEETARQEKDSTYLWGIKFETKAGSTTEFFYYKGDSFSIKDLYTGKLKDINGETIGETAKLTDKRNGEDFTCYRIYPVYKQKVAYTTINIDEDKSQFAGGTFKNGEIIKTGILDKIQINIAGKGEYAVRGFNLCCGSYTSGLTSTSIERQLESKDSSDSVKREIVRFTKRLRFSKTVNGWRKTLVNSDVAIPGSFLFSPTKTYNSLEALYHKPQITVAVNPREGSIKTQKLGNVIYLDEKDGSQHAGYDNEDEKWYEIETFSKIGKLYQFTGFMKDQNNTGYKFQWQDLTGDMNRDGELSEAEIKGLGDNYESISKGVYTGDVFNFVPNILTNSIIYYNIVPKSEKDTNVKKNVLTGTVSLETCSVIENSKLKPVKETQNIANASITAGGYTTTTDEKGKWRIESSSFDIGETYTAIIAYGGRSYTGDVTVNRTAINFKIDEYNTFDVKNFNAYRVTNDSEYDNKVDWNTHSISNSAISNEDKRHLYTFEIGELLPATAVVGKVEVERYSADGTFKKTYTAVYNKKNGLYEIKDTALLKQYKDNPDAYNYSFNPATEAVAAGDYLTVRVYDQYGVGYIKHKIGFIYKPELSVINIVNSFKSPVNNVIDFVGDVDMAFDLGLTAKMDTLDTKLSDKLESKLTVTTTDEARTISFGWNKDFEKSYDSSKKDEDKDKDKDKKDPESSEAPKTAAESVKAEAKKLEEASDKDDKAKTKAEAEAADTAKEAVDQNDEENEKSSKVTADLKVNLSVALELVMGYDSDSNRYYFKDFVVTGVVKGKASATYEYTTPIGIVIFVKGELSGDITAMLAIEPYYQNQAEPNYLYMDKAGTIDLTKLGNSDVNRQLSIYGKLMIRPKVTLTVGASLLSDKIASVSLNGEANFDMVFTTAGDGAGDVKLSSSLVLEILGGLVKKQWDIKNKTYDMFSINSGSLTSLMAGDADYRYDVITSEDTDEKLYLENRGEWNGKATAFLLSSGADSYNENTLLSGVYPHAYPQIFMIDEGESYNGSDSKQIMIFLDSEESGISLKYTIYENGQWSVPELIDNDGTNDDTPQVADLGDKLLITWSSEGDADEDDVTARLNSRDIKAAFFDKASQKLSEPQYVTHTTKEDNTSDDFASASYYVGDNGKKQLLLTYIKTEYSKTSEELTVGDLMNAYSTIAYRFYDFETAQWVDTYSGQSSENLTSLMSDAELAEFEENWYGQGFVDLSKYVTVDSGLVISKDDVDLSQYAGLWAREPQSSEISIESLASDPKIVEHETINCGKYAVSAYLVDLDKQTETIDDRDIFLQLYDFENEKFYPAMRLTNDAYNQSYLELLDAPDGVTLYYISNGDIAEQSISSILDNMIQTSANDGTEVLLINKDYKFYMGEKVILEAKEDNPYTEFIVNSDGYNVYLTWTENGISFKEGIDRNSDAATQPENYFTERQMYMAMETFEPFDYAYLDEDGNPETYPSVDANGNAIDWAVTPDINGEVGKVKAGDTIVERLYSTQWTKPVQMTDGQGANYSDIDCLMVGNGVLRCVYLKGQSEITDVAGEMIPVENEDNRSLVSADFDFNVERYTVSIDNVDDITAGREEMPVSITVKNESLLTMPDVHIELSMWEGEKKSFIDDATIDSILGGDSETVTLVWEVPSELDGISLVAIVEQGGIEFAETRETLSDESLIEITDISHEMLDRNTAEFFVTVKNSGDSNAEGERVYANCNGKVSKSEEFDLISGDTRIISFNAEIPEAAFLETRDETTITETAAVRVYTNGSIEDYPIIRSADLSLEEVMNKAISISDNDGNTYADKIAMDTGDLVILTSSIDGEDAANYPRLNIVSDNGNVVSVTNGVLTAEKAGSTQIDVELYPAVDTFETNNSAYMQAVDTYNTLPSCLVKTITMDVEVGKSGHSGSGGSSSSKETSAVSAEETAKDQVEDGTQESGWFVDVPENAWHYSAIKFAFDKGLMRGMSDTEFLPDEKLTRAMFVTVLYRLENEPDISNENLGYPFEDVDSETWYTDAVYWARQNGIVKGITDMKFAPDDNITREQMAAIMYRYAEYKGLSDAVIGASTDQTDVSGSIETEEKLDYADSDQISAWARAAVAYCTAEGLLQGKENKQFAPKYDATRAETATILQRAWVAFGLEAPATAE